MSGEVLTKEVIEGIKHYGTHIIGCEKRAETVIALCELALKGLACVPTEVATPSTIAGLETALRYLTVGLEPHTAVTEAIRLLRTTVSPPLYTEPK